MWGLTVSESVSFRECSWPFWQGAQRQGARQRQAGRQDARAAA